MSEKLHLRAGRIVKASVFGERRFAYPCDTTTVRIIEDCVGEKVNGWKNFNEYSAYVVPTRSVDPRDRYEVDKSRMVIWEREERSDG